jgi:hypothetical protein
MLVPRSISALGKIAAKESTRYAFNGVRIERIAGKARAMATDGRRALIATWEEPNAKEYPPIEGIDFAHLATFGTILPTEALDKASKACGKFKHKPVLEHFAICEPSANGTVKLAANRLDAIERIEANSIEGQFPPLDDVVPRLSEDHGPKPGYNDQSDAEPVTIETRVKSNPEGGNRAAVAMFSVDLLRGLLDAMGKAGAENVLISIPCTIGNKPMRLDAKTDEGMTLTGVLMPVNRC